MNTVQKLTELFKEFPGIGPRQAKRFVYFLLTKNEAYLKDFVDSVSKLKRETLSCASCFRFFNKGASKSNLCQICADQDKDSSLLMIVSRDVDLENIEKTNTYEGLYFVLGGIVPILEKEPENKIRIKKLLERIEKDKNKIKEIIFALSVNPDGENTEDFVKEKIKEICEKNKIKISVLGRGLSTGLELEYSDSETLKNALKNRS